MHNPPYPADHYVMWNSEGSIIHADGQCHRVPRSASMGAAMTTLDAAVSLDLPLCPCASEAHALREAALILRKHDTDVDLLMSDDGCLICRAKWVGDIDTERGATLTHARLCLLPVLVWLPEEVAA